MGIAKIRNLLAKAKSPFLGRDELSLAEQHEKYFGDSDIVKYGEIYTTIASVLGEDVVYLRPTDKFCDHWSDLDGGDLLAALCRRLHITSIRSTEFKGRFDSVRTIGDFVRAFQAVVEKSNGSGAELVE